jgi:hypothetical protein
MDMYLIKQALIDSYKNFSRAGEPYPFVSKRANVQLDNKYVKNLRYFDNPGFENLILDLLSVDYALLIQKDPSIKRRNRYAMTHFHVKIDWPIDDATEEAAAPPQ